MTRFGRSYWTIEDRIMPSYHVSAGDDRCSSSDLIRSERVGPRPCVFEHPRAYVDFFYHLDSRLEWLYVLDTRGYEKRIAV